ncbi:hypothetical protein K4K49_005092 [Colletotrichum sp. SAR 10_70]|nr:hypothetical protein K4K50_004554 [Colletotrichum sp. SAR 10_71]KAI8168188.1 hypothetical protein K4K49_005092 [Colletotrichum sp. SAR 10_70]
MLGRCTGTAGCIANAEIKEIISSGGSKRQYRVVTHFLDASSHSDMLVYDNNQWIGYMSESTKAARVKLSAGLGMAGTTDWASDLQQFNPVPKPAKDWASFIALAASGNDPKQSTITIGKWKNLTCEADVIVDPYFMTPTNRWKAVDADSAWPAADDIEDTFAPIPEEKTNQWLNILIDVLTIGTLGAAGPVFNGFRRALPAFTNPKTFENTKDTVLMLMGQTATLAKDILSTPDQDPWIPQEQNKFSNYMGQVIFGWMGATEFTIGKLLGGSKEYVTVLGALISEGKLIDGKREGPLHENLIATEMRANMNKTFYGYSIPALCRRSKTYAFILNSEEGCSGNPLSKYVDDDITKATSVCHNGILYHLVPPKDNARVCECKKDTDHGPCQNVCRDNKFSAPVGLSRLKDFGNLSVDDLVKGSVETWLYNKNVNKRLNITQMSLERPTQSDLLDVNIRTPGFVQLPVCSADRAFQSWDTGKTGSSHNYPCDIPPGKDHCGASSFENRGSGVSPKLNDCQQIIRNIEGDASADFTHRITGQRQILEFGLCHFGIERTGGTGGAVELRVGG